MKLSVISFGVVLCLAACEFTNTQNLQNFQSPNGNFDGLWRATNVLDTLGPSSRNCLDSEFRIDQSGSALTIQPRRFECGTRYIVNWDRLPLNIDGTRLLSNGTVVGSIGNDYIDVIIPVGSVNTWKFSIRRVGDALEYTETTSGDSTSSATIGR